MQLRIISGGQMGADLGGLFAAKENGIETGGFAPKGWQTVAGPQPELLKTFGLVEGKPGYPWRTRANIELANITIICASSFTSAGTAMTIRLCEKLRKPYVRISVSDLSKIDELARDITAKMKKSLYTSINVAGNRDHGESTFHFDMAYNTISAIIANFKKVS